MLQDLLPNPDSLEPTRENTPSSSSDPDATALSTDELEKIVQSRHDAPHRVLGPHLAADGTTIILRAFIPSANRVSVHFHRPTRGAHEMRRIHDEGLFQAAIPGDGELDYELIAVDAEGQERRFRDPYAFTAPWFDGEDQRLFLAGEHVRLFDKLGAHPLERDGVPGVMFAVWAPHALRVSVVGTFNRWDGRCHQMRRVHGAGVWEIFIPDVRAGDLYKFEIKNAEGGVFLRSDPFAFRTETLPKSASVVDPAGRNLSWRDTQWLSAGRKQLAAGPRAGIHAIDLDECPQSGTSEGNRPALVERVSAEALAAIAEKGCSYVEFVSSAPGRWGSASGFAPGEPCGTPEELLAFVDACHAQGMGVIVPAFDSRLPEAFADMTWFDGTQLFEAPADPHGPSWRLFATERGEVRSFLLSNAAFWLERYHVDGLRTDARCARLYRKLNELLPGGTGGARIIVSEPPAIHGLSRSEADRIAIGRHDKPHAILGAHYSESARELTLRAMAPEASRVSARSSEGIGIEYELRRIHPAGLFEIVIPDAEPGGRHRFQALRTDGSSYEYLDAYGFTEFAVSDFDQHLFGAGNHYRVNERLGAHPRTEGGVEGVGFALWAPNADGVGVVGQFNGWDGRRHQMTRHGVSGIWETFIPEIGEGELYKFEIRSNVGHVLLKSDPYALYSEVPPATASVVYRMQGAYRWSDREWMARRSSARWWEEPIAIYEVHLGSWMRGPNNEPLSYLQLAEELIPYVKKIGFTHIELLPVAEHPYEPSWGYQVTGYYSPSSRFGRPEGLMQFVDRCHENGIGVLLDWVAGHFPKDAHGLAYFDGTCLYEHADPRQGEHRDWGTLIFNYGRHEVENFLIANARFWLEHYHFDGLRVDAVASMLYLDYSRPRPGDWIPNKYGGRENLEAIEFLKHTNVVVHGEFPGVMTIAEESTAWPNVSRPVDKGGLGFGYKWNMGWMHDVLAYMSTPMEQRRHHHSKLTFGLVYAFAENYVLSLSHDEVVHMKRSLLGRMPGNDSERFANLRLLYAFMYAHPGKKLLFMGAEFGQVGEWDHSRGLEWQLLEFDQHRQVQAFVRDLNRLYRTERAFFESDFKGVGFEWLDVDNAEQCTVAFLRKAKDPRNALLFILNFSNVSRQEHRVGVPYPGPYKQLLNSNAPIYGGSGEGVAAGQLWAEEVPWHAREFSIKITLPALSAIILKPGAPDTVPLLAPAV
jgi:1,4-alpha-glucan branching enzyme